MKKLALIAALGAAAIFTACGDDDSSDNASCTYKMGQMEICGEGPDPDGEAEDYCKEMGGTFGSSCKGGASLTCSVEDGTIYIYGEANGMNCSFFTED